MNVLMGAFRYVFKRVNEKQRFFKERSRLFSTFTLGTEKKKATNAAKLFKWWLMEPLHPNTR